MATSAPVRQSVDPVINGIVVCHHGVRARRCDLENNAERCKFWVWRDTLLAPPGTLDDDEQDEHQQGQGQQAQPQPQGRRPSPPFPAQAQGQLQSRPRPPRFIPARAPPPPQAPAGTTINLAFRTGAALSEINAAQAMPVQNEPDQDSDMPPPLPRTQPLPPERPRGLSNARQSRREDPIALAQPQAQGEGRQGANAQAPAQAQGATGSRSVHGNDSQNTSNGSFFGLPDTPAPSEAALPLHEAQVLPPPLPPPHAQAQGPGTSSQGEYVVVRVPSPSSSSSGPGRHGDPGAVPALPTSNSNPNANVSTNVGRGAAPPFPRPANAANVWVTPVAQRTLARSGNGDDGYTPNKRTPEGRAARLRAMQKALEESEAAAAAGRASTAATAGGTSADPFGSEAVGFGQVGPMLVDRSTSNENTMDVFEGNTYADRARFNPAQVQSVSTASQRNRSGRNRTEQANGADDQPPGPGPSPMRMSPQKRQRSPLRESASRAGPPEASGSGDARVSAGAAADARSDANSNSNLNANGRARGLLFRDELTIFDDVPPGPSPPQFQPRPRPAGVRQAQAGGRPADAQTERTGTQETFSQTLAGSPVPDLDEILGPVTPDPDFHLDLASEQGQGHPGTGLHPRLSQVESPSFGEYRPRAPRPTSEQYGDPEHEQAHETTYETALEGYETVPLDADADGEDSSCGAARTLNKSPTKRRRLAGENGESRGGLMTPPDTRHRSASGNGARVRTRGGTNVDGTSPRAGPSRPGGQRHRESEDEGWPMDVESPSGARAAKKASAMKEKGKGKEKAKERRTNASAMEREMSVDPEWDDYSEESAGKIPAPLFHPSPTPEPAALLPDATHQNTLDTGARIRSALREAPAYLERLERKLHATQSSVNARTARNGMLEAENADLRTAVADLRAKVAELMQENERLRSTGAAARVDEGSMDVEESRPRAMQRRAIQRDREEIRKLREQLARLERRLEATED